MPSSTNTTGIFLPELHFQAHKLQWHAAAQIFKIGQWVGPLAFISLLIRIGVL